MALHGEVKVNGQDIIRWSARRTVDLIPDRLDALYPYAIAVVCLVDGKVTDYDDGVILHSYSSGAPALVAAVMAWAQETSRIWAEAR